MPGSLTPHLDKEITPLPFLFPEAPARPLVVYVAHPYASDPEGNVLRAAAVCREIVHRYPDVVPVCPLMMFRYLSEDGPAERGRNLAYCLALLERCDELWLAGEWYYSEGCLLEWERALQLGLPIQEYPAAERGEA